MEEVLAVKALIEVKDSTDLLPGIRSSFRLLFVVEMVILYLEDRDRL